MTHMTAKAFSGLAAAVAVAIGLAMPGCASSAPPAGDPGAAVPVTVSRVGVTDVADTFDAGGVVEARTTATLTARILAPVREVRVAPGERVGAGQVLVVLDGRDLGAHARGARAAAEAAEQGATAAAAEQQAAEAAQTLARARYERVTGLHAKRSATAHELDTATSVLRAAEAGAAGAAARAKAAVSAVAAATAASEAAGTTESFSLITAPFDGLVTEKLVEPGNMAVPGGPLMRLDDTRGFRLDVRVDESRAAQVSLGAVVPVALDAGATGATATVDGTITEISRAVDADARAFLVKIALPVTEGMRSGMFGRARFSAPPRRALTLPSAALVRRGQVTSVLVAEAGVARLRFVNVSGTEILAGLADGDMVITNPPPSVTDGTRVTTGGR